MRNRRPSCSAVEGPDGVAAVTHPRSLPSSSLAHNEVSFRPRRELNPNDAEVCDTHAMRLLNEATDEERCRGPYWRARCSRSILLGLLIWATIGFVVHTKLDSANSRHGLEPATNAAGTALSELPDGCRSHYCRQDGVDAPFGAVLGAHDGIVAYSNCNSDSCTSLLEHQISVPLPPRAGTALATLHAKTRIMTTGMKWQCVEYARRYWMLRGTPTPATFDSVHGAADIWDSLTFATILSNGTKVPLLKFRNGAKLDYGGSSPRAGDLLLYPRDDKGEFPFGHVAVVVGVTMPSRLEAGNVQTDATAAASQPRRRHGLVYIAEQNWNSSPWPEPHRNFSRSLTLEVLESAEGRPLQYNIRDSYYNIDGWVRYDVAL
ncbi:hypothetical protein CUR178_02063 [Leishmania enriettii]|uniref:Peptidase C51 domain-containing protein n=1 Tax=Leishmania enriettii TaxID=5663 RepID=A0A836G848_LEIEN|nr:hypothetical protein CUR178_02063 [Leishmania enriettii]